MEEDKYKDIYFETRLNLLEMCLTIIVYKLIKTSWWRKLFNKEVKEIILVHKEDLIPRYDDTLSKVITQAKEEYNGRDI